MASENLAQARKFPSKGRGKSLNLRLGRAFTEKLAQDRRFPGRGIGEQHEPQLKVHKNENFFGFDFEFCTISLLVMSKY